MGKSRECSAPWRPEVMDSSGAGVRSPCEEPKVGTELRSLLETGDCPIAPFENAYLSISCMLGTHWFLSLRYSASLLEASSFVYSMPLLNACVSQYQVILMMILMKVTSMTLGPRKLPVHLTISDPTLGPLKTTRTQPCPWLVNSESLGKCD